MPASFSSIGFAGISRTQDCSTSLQCSAGFSQLVMPIFAPVDKLSGEEEAGACSFLCDPFLFTRFWQEPSPKEKPSKSSGSPKDSPAPKKSAGSKKKADKKKKQDHAAHPP